MTLKQHRIVVVAGLSGVGKTFLIKELNDKSDKFVHFSAGTLIKKRLSQIDHDSLRQLESDRIIQNQYLLLEQLQQELQYVPEDKMVLFDAHMLIDTDRELVEIPFEIFEKLAPQVFVFILESPDNIIRRRVGDSDRKRPLRNRIEIEKQQDNSLRICKEYAQQLGASVLIKKSSDAEAVLSFLEDGEMFGMFGVGVKT